MVDFQNAPIAYGTANTASFKDVDDPNELYYQAARLKNLYLLDFGEVNKNQRVGMQLTQNGIKSPCIIKSIHASAQSKTDDGLVWEIHESLTTGVASRIALQYLDRKDAPFAHPDFVLFPENVIYVIPGQDANPRIVLEPINLLVHATTLI